MRHTSLIVLPTIITKTGRYKTRCGEEVIIVLVGKPGAAYDCIGQYPCGTGESWDKSGRVLPFTESRNDIVECLN